MQILQVSMHRTTLYKAFLVPPQVRVPTYCAKIGLSSIYNWSYELAYIAPTNRATLGTTCAYPADSSVTFTRCERPTLLSLPSPSIRYLPSFHRFILRKAGLWDGDNKQHLTLTWPDSLVRLPVLAESLRKVKFDVDCSVELCLLDARLCLLVPALFSIFTAMNCLHKTDSRGYVSCFA